MAGMHEITFSWPEVDANAVIVTGTFDQWSCSVHLTKTPHGFEGKVKVPWGERVLYKFVVDGRWVTARWQPEESDASGNINNVYECPPKPEFRLAVQGASPSDIPPESESKHDELENSAATRPIPFTDLDHLSERASPAAQDATPESTRSVLNQANETSVLGDAKKLGNDSASTAEQAKENMHRTFLDTAQVSEAHVFMADQDQIIVPSLAEPATQALHGVAISEPLTQVKEQGTAIPEAVPTNTIGVDPLDQGKIPTATPERTHDSLTVNTHGSTPQGPSPHFVEPESYAESVPTVNILPATLVPDAAETSEMGLVTRVDQNVQSEAAVKDYLAVNDTSHKELDKSTFTPTCLKEPTAASDITKTIETEANTSASLTSNGSSSEVLLVATVGPQLERGTDKMPFFTVEGARTEAFSPTEEGTSVQLTDTLDTGIAGAGPVPTEIDHLIPTAEAPPTEVSPSAQVQTVDVQGATPTPDVPSEASPVNTTMVSAESTAASTDFTQTASVSEKSRNGHTVSTMQPASSSRDTQSSSATSSHAAPKSGSARKKRKSLFGKVIQLFSAEKEEKKKR